MKEKFTIEITQLEDFYRAILTDERDGSQAAVKTFRADLADDLQNRMQIDVLMTHMAEVIRHHFFSRHSLKWEKDENGKYVCLGYPYEQK